jgi:hypothetical protein
MPPCTLPDGSHPGQVQRSPTGQTQGPPPGTFRRLSSSQPVRERLVLMAACVVPIHPPRLHEARLCLPMAGMRRAITPYAACPVRSLRQGSSACSSELFEGAGERPLPIPTEQASRRMRVICRQQTGAPTDMAFPLIITWHGPCPKVEPQDLPSPRRSLRTPSPAATASCTAYRTPHTTPPRALPGP